MRGIMIGCYVLSLLFIPDSCSSFSLSLIHSYFVTVQGCRKELILLLYCLFHWNKNQSHLFINDNSCQNVFLQGFSDLPILQGNNINLANSSIREKKDLRVV